MHLSDNEIHHKDDFTLHYFIDLYRQDKNHKVFHNNIKQINTKQYKQTYSTNLIKI